MKDENEKRAWEMFRKSIGPHIWTSNDLFVFFGIGLLFGILMTLPLVALADNLITMEQTGDNLNLEIQQYGADNEVKMLDQYSYINASSLDLLIVQYNNEGNDNTIVFDEISGTGNEFKLGQGVAFDNTTQGWNYNGAEGGGHYMEIDLYGNDNHLQWHQTNRTGATDGHDFNLHVAGSDNWIDGRQQDSGAKEANITLYNSDNTLTFRQKGTNANHTANITLDGIYGTDALIRQLGTTNQTYNLSVDCYTVGGCSVSVLQE